MEKIEVKKKEDIRCVFPSGVLQVKTYQASSESMFRSGEGYKRAWPAKGEGTTFSATL